MSGDFRRISAERSITWRRTEFWRRTGSVKTRELANVCAPSLAALRPPLHAGFARVRRQPHLAFAFLRHAGLEF